MEPEITEVDTGVSQEDQTTPPPRDLTLLGTEDAMVWAEEFVRIFTGKVVGPDWDGVDEGLMVGWFANAMAIGEQFGIKRLMDNSPVLWCFEHFFHMDKANACMHCAPVRFSPITFRLAEFLNKGYPAMFVESHDLNEVLHHSGMYEEDAGR